MYFRAGMKRTVYAFRSHSLVSFLADVGGLFAFLMVAGGLLTGLNVWYEFQRDLIGEVY